VIGSLAEYLEWDTRTWGVALDFWIRHTRQTLHGCAALEIGGRHGGLSLWLAQQGASVVCSDKGGPSPQAREKHARGGVAQRVSYAVIDATCIPHRESFDVVMFKSVLGAVGRQGGRRGQAAAVQEMYQAVRSGGELFFAENLVASPLHTFCRRHFVPWGQRWRYVTLDEMQAFLAPFSQVRYQTLGFAGAFGRTPGQQRMLGALDRLCLDAWVPARWHYVMIGLARK
jgi:SAM-dependent methyltransferase